MSSLRTLTTILALAAATIAPALAADAGAAGPRCNAAAHQAGPALHRGEVVDLNIAPDFAPYERAKLLQAVNEWNQALGGALRFDIVEAPAAGPAPVWQVLDNRSLSPKPAPRGGYQLAVTLGSAAGGGIVLVNTAEIDGRDIATVMRHELGHVLGLCHDPTGGLMTAHYSPHDQGCIDQVTIAALADELAVPASRLHGCARR